jgi:hypothetical protein
VSRKPTLVGLAEPAPPLPRFDTADPLRQSEDPIRLSDSDLEEPSNPGQLKINPPGGALPPPPGVGGNTAAALANTFLAPKAGASAAPKPVVAARPSVAPKPNLKATQVGGFRAPAATAKSPAKPAPMQFDDAVTVVTPPPFAAQLMPQLKPSTPPPPAPAPVAPRKPSPPPVAPPPPPPVELAADAPLPRFGEASAPSHTPPTPFAATAVAHAPRVPSKPPSPPRPPRGGDTVNPDASTVLDHLARVGLYEPGGGATPAWETPPRQKTRGTIAILVATVLIAGGGVGAWVYAKRVKEARALEASTLNSQVDKLLKTGSPSDLKTTDERLTRSFELDSLSQRAARLWLQNRVLGALLLPG